MIAEAVETLLPLPGGVGNGIGPGPSAIDFVLSPPTTSASTNIQKSVLETFAFICFSFLSVFWLLMAGSRPWFHQPLKLCFVPFWNSQKAYLKASKAGFLRRFGRIGFLYF